MEYQFVRHQFLGQYTVQCDMGFEVIARWLQDEISINLECIEGLLRLIESAQQQPNQEFRLLGKEISLFMSEHEARIQENALGYDSEPSCEEEWGFYDSESLAQCGLPDLYELVTQWKAFITTA
ncbi:UPF0231 family protein [Vibrio cincinnatiensis]|uniref:YacL family protein n=1 Tax=Vibrio cincinnatiensis TaxID=675 RepID=UPI001EE05D9D|nr:YacL family protein [Vibrio cincinnatiensis]MCG3766254.1 UPF0231 family protein [Vibrio cincinnatiensis]